MNTKDKDQKLNENGKQNGSDDNKEKLPTGFVFSEGNHLIENVDLFVDSDLSYAEKYESIKDLFSKDALIGIVLDSQVQNYEYGSSKGVANRYRVKIQLIQKIDQSAYQMTEKGYSGTIVGPTYNLFIPNDKEVGQVVAIRARGVAMLNIPNHRSELGKEFTSPIKNLVVATTLLDAENRFEAGLKAARDGEKTIKVQDAKVMNIIDMRPSTLERFERKREAAFEALD